MRAMRAEGFGGYKDLKLVDIPKPTVSDGRVLVKITAAGVTPIDYTILSGGHLRGKAPLVLGGEGAGVVEEGGGKDFAVGSRVMFAGPYGVSENGTYSEWLAVRKENLCLIPDNIEDVSAAGVSVAYLTAQMTLSLAGFARGKRVLSPAIGGSVGNDDVIDLSVEKLSHGVRRITEGDGADIVIDAIGGEILGEALGTLAMGGSLTTLGYAAGRKATIDVTDLIWKRASMKSFSLFAQPAEAWNAAWSVIIPLLQSGAVKPIVAKTFPLPEAADALCYLVEGRPFGRVVLTI
jgi:NADPH2:quinone reductase